LFYFYKKYKVLVITVSLVRWLLCAI